MRRRGARPETAPTVTEMMRGVVETRARRRQAAMDGYTVAGKTGTAQKADPVTGGYSADKQRRVVRRLRRRPTPRGW